MPYLLDTNVISEMRRGRPHGAVLAWVEATKAEDLFVSAISIAELQAGVELTRETDAGKAAEIEHWINQVVATTNVISLDAVIFRRWAKLMHRRADALYEDAMIAATAIERRLTVATRNVRDFSPFGVEVFNPFET